MASAIHQLAQDVGSEKPAGFDAPAIRRDKFKAALERSIDVMFAEIMRGKAEADRFLTYVDGQILSSFVRNIFIAALGTTPPQIDAACRLSEAVLAPTSLERRKLMKAAVGAGGGATGIAMVIAGIGSALGWGQGVLASITAFFVGTSLAGPIGWMVAGATLSGVAAYFSTTSNRHTDTERFLKVLKSSTARAVDEIWSENDEALSSALKPGAAK